MSATCERVTGELYAAMRGELPASEAGEVEDHVAACDACRAEQAGMANLAAFLGSAPEPEPAPDGFLRVREAIERGERNRRRRLRLLLPLPLAAAAALLLAFLLPPPLPSPPA